MIVCCFYLNFEWETNNNAAISGARCAYCALSLVRFARKMGNRMKIALFIYWYAEGKCISVAYTLTVTQYSRAQGACVFHPTNQRTNVYLM